MLSRADRAYAEEFKRAAAERFGADVEEVRIFGSRARGDSRPDSDLDLFVCMRREDRSLLEAIRDLAWDVAESQDLPYTVSPRVMSRAHFQRLVSLERLLARDILEQGVLIS